MRSVHERKAIDELIAKAPNGTRIEFGVLHGNNLSRLAQHRGLTIGVDSFQGMPASTERDRKDGKDPYHKGRLACPIERVQKNIRGIDNIKLVEGWVPGVLDTITERDFAYAYVDMDQYDSTLAALKWLETRMLPGGIICCDDWLAERDWLAAGAINEFAKTRPLSGTCGHQAWFCF